MDVLLPDGTMSTGSATIRASTRADVRTSGNYETDYWAVYHFGLSQDLALHQDAERDRVVRRYLENCNVPQLEAPAWVSQREAARELNVAVLRIGLLIANEHLEAAEDLERNMGVTRISLDAERRWWQETLRLSAGYVPYATASTGSSEASGRIALSGGHVRPDPPLSGSLWSAETEALPA